MIVFSLPDPPAQESVMGHGIDEVKEEKGRSYKAAERATPSSLRGFPSSLEEKDEYDCDSRYPIGENKPISPKYSQSILSKPRLSRLFQISH